LSYRSPEEILQPETKKILPARSCFHSKLSTALRAFPVLLSVLKGRIFPQTFPQPQLSIPLNS
jgi:hypothetical protein